MIYNYKNYCKCFFANVKVGTRKRFKYFMPFVCRDSHAASPDTEQVRIAMDALCQIKPRCNTFTQPLRYSYLHEFFVKTY